MDTDINAALIALCIKVQGIELTYIIGNPPDRAWVVRGWGEDPENKRDAGKMVEYFGAEPKAAVAAALAAHP